MLADERGHHEPELLVLSRKQPETFGKKGLAVLATRLNWGEFTLRQRLLAKMPRPIMKFPNHEAGLIVEQEFNTGGVNCFLLSEKALKQYEKIPAIVLALSENEIKIQPMVGNHKTIPLNNLLCAVSAKVEFRSQTVSRTVGMFTDSVNRTVDFPEQFRVLDLHLVDQKRCYRFQEDQLKAYFDLNNPEPSESGISTFCAQLAFSLSYFPHFHGFSGNAQYLSNSLQIVSQSRTAVAPPLGKLAHKLEIRTREEFDERPLFDLYSVLSRYDLVLGNACV